MAGERLVDIESKGDCVREVLEIVFWFVDVRYCRINVKLKQTIDFLNIKSNYKFKTRLQFRGDTKNVSTLLVRRYSKKL